MCSSDLMFVGVKRLIAFLNSLGLSADNLNPKEMLMLMKAFRFDVRSYFRYFARRAHDKQKKLAVPVFSILGEVDRLTKGGEGKGGWSLLSDSPIHTTTIPSANHYFIKDQAAELAESIVQSLQMKNAT